MIENKKLDDLYRKKKEIEIKGLELEREELTLLLEMKKLTNNGVNNGKREFGKEAIKKDNSLYIS